MGFFSFWKRKASEPTGIQSAVIGGPVFSGARVNEIRAMGLSAHFACVQYISRTIASLPVHVYQKTAAGQIRRGDHPAARLLRERPNPDMTAYSFTGAMQSQASAWGKAYAEIVFDRRGYPAELWPVSPGKAEPRRRKDGKLEYYFHNTQTALPWWKVVQIPGLTFDGVNIQSVSNLFKQTFGFALAVEEFGSLFYGQGANIGGILTHKTKLSDEAVKRLKTALNDYKGLRNSHSVLVLEEGMDYVKQDTQLEQIQFIEIRKFIVTEIARIHGVPPHIIGDLERATFSNIEEQAIEAVRNCILPWTVNWEQALNSRLFTEEERRNGYFIKFEIDGLLRGNTEARFKAYAIGLQNGIYNVDEVREKEDMNPLPNGQGKIHRFPLNMTGKEKGTRYE